MNGPCKMYKLRPIVNLSDNIELPNCMYKMKNIQELCFGTTDLTKDDKTSSISEQVKKFLKVPLPEVTALENRQDEILKQLAELKESIASLQTKLKQPSETTKSDKTNNISSHKLSCLKNFHDVVVNVNPTKIPFSLMALKNLWKTSLQVNIKFHTHSSVCDSPSLFTLTDTDNSNNKPQMNISVIWKNVDDLELVLSPLRHTIVRGEVNFLRFLSRIGPSKFNYEECNNEISTKIDEILDLCYDLSRTSRITERKALIRKLNRYSGQNVFLAGLGDPSVADLAAWSVLKQLSCTTKENLIINMQKWFLQCNKVFGFDD